MNSLNTTKKLLTLILIVSCRNWLNTCSKATDVDDMRRTNPPFAPKHDP